MTRSPRLLLILAAWMLAATMLMCSTNTMTGETDPDGFQETSDAEAFETSNARFTQTAEATGGASGTDQPTATRAATNTAAPTATLPDPLNILAEQSDDMGDTVNCLTNSPAPDDG